MAILWGNQNKAEVSLRIIGIIIYMENLHRSVSITVISRIITLYK